MADLFQITPPVIRAEGKDVPPEQIQAGFNSLARQTQLALNTVGSDPTGPAGGDLSGNYPNPTVTGSHISSGTISGVVITGSALDSTPIGQSAASSGAFTTVTATTPVGVASGGTGQNTLSAHNVLLGEGTGGVGFAAPGTSGQILASTGAAADPSFQTKTALAIASSGANSDITSLSALSTPLSVAQGGTGRATLLAHGVLVGEGTAGINQLAVGNTGQMLLGSSGADPAFGNNPTITGGTINGAAVGGTTPAAGAFTTLNASGNDALLYTNTSAQSIPNNAVTTVTGWTQTFDRLGANFNASTGTFTAPATGYYQVTAQIVYGAGTLPTSTVAEAIIMANGSAVATGVFAREAATSAQTSVWVSAVVSLAAGQTIVLQTFQNSGAAATLNAPSSQNYLAINRLP